jgi:DNA-directed RNA polymerase subunit RPC12/RpoP
MNEAKIREIVDKQAKDDGCWFRAQTCAEAYLQQQLRLLHAAIEDNEHCNCHRCIKEFDLSDGYGFKLSATRMIVCPDCGNKRCPKASDHRLACTDSNEPGQPGSIYQ